MTRDQLINVLVTITLLEMMAAIGLGVTFADLAGVARNWRLVTRAALANYVCVPAATVGLLLLLKPHPLVAAGFLILAVCPGAPYGPPLTSIARGNVAVAVGLMGILAGSSALGAPILLHYLLPLVSRNEATTIDTTRIVNTLLVTQLMPLCVGVAVRQWRPTLADRLQGPANHVSKLLNLVAVGFILVEQSHLLMEIRPRGFVGMLALLFASWAAGWLLGGTRFGQPQGHDAYDLAAQRWRWPGHRCRELPRHAGHHRSVGVWSVRSLRVLTFGSGVGQTWND
jgi:BASS family bile acid:Na+ symporter